MLRTRILSAVVLVPPILAIVVFGEPWVSLLVGVAAFLAMIELIALLDAGGFEPPQVLGLVVGLATLGAGLLVVNEGVLGSPLSDLVRVADPPGLVVVTFAAGVLLLGIVGFTRPDPRAGFLTWATAVFGVAYIGLLGPFVALVAHLAPMGGMAGTAVGPLGLPSGGAWLLLLLLTVWGYDSGAYLTGRWLGRRQLIVHISPAKTVEGMAGGLLAATVAAGIGAWLVGLEAWHPLVLGPVVGLAAQAGDLVESMLKRAAGRKESGFLIPGHGGVLDRVDSFLFAAPVVATFALLVAGRHA